MVAINRVSLFCETDHNGTECSVALLCRMKQLVNISLHANPFCLGCVVIYAATELHIYSLHTLYPMQILIVSVLIDKLYSINATALYEIAS